MTDHLADSGNPQEGFAFDSDRQYLGEVYAKALLGAAHHQGASGGEMLEELESFVHDVLGRQPRLTAVLQSPRISFGEKEALLNKALEGKMHPVLLTFLKVIARRGRMNCLREIARSTRRLVNEEQGRVQVSVKTAAAIDEPLRETILNRLQQALGAAVELRTEVDPSIVGGLVVRIGDTVYDGSVFNRLKKMRADAVVNTVQAFRQSMSRFAENSET